MMCAISTIMIMCVPSGSSKEVSIGFNKFSQTNFDLTDRIVNGTKARSGMFPHQVTFMRCFHLI